MSSALSASYIHVYVKQHGHKLDQSNQVLIVFDSSVKRILECI